VQLIKQSKLLPTWFFSPFVKVDVICNISHVPSTDLSGFQASTPKLLELLIAKDQKKYNYTEMKYRATLYSCHTALGT
jgi:hypothetical protein